jgi:hypothetical protein
VRHSARHRAPRRGILRRRVQLPVTRRRSARRRSALPGGPAAAVLAASVVALLSSPPAAAAVIRPARTGAAADAVARTSRPAAPAAGPGPARRPPVVVVDCARRPVLAPRALVITCADADDYLTQLTWTSWGSVAFGRGIERINDCTPCCAAGHLHAYRVLITLWRAEPLARRPRLRFTRLTELYTGRRPVEYTGAGRPYRPQAVTWRLQASTGRGSGAGRPDVR